MSDQNQLATVADRGRLYSASNIIGLGLKGQAPEHLQKKCWMSFPEDNCPYYRMTVFSNYSPHHVPDNTRYWSLMTEVSESPYKSIRHEDLLEQVIQGALNTNLI